VSKKRDVNEKEYHQLNFIGGYTDDYKIIPETFHFQTIASGRWIALSLDRFQEGQGRRETGFIAAHE